MDTQTDADHCGACATQCGTSETCVAGACTCGSGELGAGGAQGGGSRGRGGGSPPHAVVPGCTHRLGDTAAALSAACVTALCCCLPAAPAAAGCTGTHTCCGADGCVDTQTDADHCGACATQCGTSETCVAGACTCGSGELGAGGAQGGGSRGRGGAHHRMPWSQAAHTDWATQQQLFQRLASRRSAVASLPLLQLPAALAPTPAAVPTAVWTPRPTLTTAAHAPPSAAPARPVLRAPARAAAVSWVLVGHRAGAAVGEGGLTTACRGPRLHTPTGRHSSSSFSGLRHGALLLPPCRSCSCRLHWHPHLLRCRRLCGHPDRR